MWPRSSGGASVALLLAVVVAALLPPAADAWVSPGRRCLSASAARPSPHGLRHRHGGAGIGGVRGVSGGVGISVVGTPTGAGAGRGHGYGRGYGAGRGPTSRSQVASAVSKQGFDSWSDEAYEIPGALPL